MGRFLLASDDARTRIGVAGALERAGHEVDRVTHLGLAAMSADLQGLDGVVIGLSQHVRRERFIEGVRARRPGVPVLTLLDSHNTWQAQRLEALGVEIVLARPFRAAELVTRLEELVEGRRVGRTTHRARRGPILTLSRPRITQMPARA